MTFVAKVDRFFSKTKKSVNYIKNIPVGDEYLHEDFSFKNQRHVVLSVLLIIFAIAVNVLFFSLKNTVFKASADVTPPAPTNTPYPMKVLSISYYPTLESSSSAQILDNSVTGMQGETTLDSVRAKVSVLRDLGMNKLEEGSKYHGYKDPNAQPSLDYSLVEQKEFLKPIPISGQFKAPNTTIPTADHFKVLNGSDTTLGINNICDYVDNQGVKEVWIWFYHTNAVAPIESNMAPKTGGDFGTEGYKDVSNSGSFDDLPRCAKTYSAYDFNYTQDGMPLHNHGHQFEKIFSSVDDIYTSFATYGLTGKVGCGSVHNPPNTPASGQYIYNAEVQVQSDCANWKPDGTGVVETVSCHTWVGADCGTDAGAPELKERIWWMQNIPGFNNGLTYHGKPMRNWWSLVGDWDNPVNKPPVVQITSPQAGATFQDNFQVAVNASHPNGIAKVEFFINSQTTPIATSTTAPYLANINLSQLTHGATEIRAKATTNGNSFGSEAQVGVSVINNYIDVSAPMIKVDSPRFNQVFQDKRVNLRADFIDSAQMGRVIFHIVKIGGGGISRSYDRINKINEDFVLEDGNYQLTMAFYDDSANQSSFTNIFTVKADPDKDGFLTTVESKIGTNENLGCGLNAWPPDFNSDKVVNSADQGLLSTKIAPKGSPNYDKRYDLNADGAVNSGDQGMLVGFVSKKCTVAAVVQPIVFQPNLIQCTYDGELVSSGHWISALGQQIWSGEIMWNNDPSGTIVWVDVSTGQLLGGNISSYYKGEARAMFIRDLYYINSLFEECENTRVFL